MKNWDNDKHEEVLEQKELKKIDNYKASLEKPQHESSSFNTKEYLKENRFVLTFETNNRERYLFIQDMCRLMMNKQDVDELRNKIFK